MNATRSYRCAAWIERNWFRKFNVFAESEMNLRESVYNDLVQHKMIHIGKRNCLPKFAFQIAIEIMQINSANED